MVNFSLVTSVYVIKRPTRRRIQVLKSIYKIVSLTKRRSMYANGSEQKPQSFTTHRRHVSSCYTASQRWHLWSEKR